MLCVGTKNFTFFESKNYIIFGFNPAKAGFGFGIFFELQREKNVRGIYLERRIGFLRFFHLLLLIDQLVLRPILIVCNLFIEIYLGFCPAKAGGFGIYLISLQS